MGTTREEIRGWLEQGKKQDATHMIVVCDEFDYEDYPVYVTKEEDARKKFEEYNNKEMQKVMEVYSLSLPFEPQLLERRAFHYETEAPKVTQKERADNAVACLMKEAYNPTAVQDLKNVIDEAQNGPPEGAADGTIDEAMWDMLRRLHQHFFGIEATMEDYERDERRKQGGK